MFGNLGGFLRNGGLMGMLLDRYRGGGGGGGTVGDWSQFQGGNGGGDLSGLYQKPTDFPGPYGTPTDDPYGGYNPPLDLGGNQLPNQGPQTYSGWGSGGYRPRRY